MDLELSTGRRKVMRLSNVTRVSYGGAQWNTYRLTEGEFGFYWDMANYGNEVNMLNNENRVNSTKERKQIEWASRLMSSRVNNVNGVGPKGCEWGKWCNNEKRWKYCK